MQSMWSSFRQANFCSEGWTCDLSLHNPFHNLNWCLCFVVNSLSWLNGHTEKACQMWRDQTWMSQMLQFWKKVRRLSCRRRQHSTTFEAIIKNQNSYK
jgi:hypothetical protein